MTQWIPFHQDPADPRAPTDEQWTSMTPDERARVVASLPSTVPFELFMPEGDPHRLAKERALGALGAFFAKIGRKVYLSSELAVYYPGEPRFAPDVLAVVDVEPHPRMKWVVADEGRGLDIVLEVHVSGEWEKDFEANRNRYARLGIPEYFLFDRTCDRLFGWRLPSATARVYEGMVPQLGKLTSRVLGLDLGIEADRVRFYYGTAPLPEAEGSWRSSRRWSMIWWSGASKSGRSASLNASASGKNLSASGRSARWNASARGRSGRRRGGGSRSLRRSWRGCGKRVDQP